jgi:thioester reductase-like protein
MSGRARSHVVTGATGLVGGAIVLELLRQPHAHVSCVVRAASPQLATARLHEALRSAAALYDVDIAQAVLDERCVAISGDITQSACGVDRDVLPREVDELWHCAASLKYADRDRDEIELHNVTGTANVVALAGELGVACLNHVSTAYVAGTRSGWIPEAPVDPSCPPNNVYEETKRRGEELAWRAGADVVRILRPSIVIGHSRTTRCASDTGIYGFMDQLKRFKLTVERQLGDYLVHRSVALLGEPQARINLIPIDVVAAAATQLSGADAPSGIYHLASLDPPTLEECLGLLMEYLELRPPRFVEHERQLSSIDAAFNRGAEFHRAYLLQDKDFDCASTMRVCGPDLLRTDLRGRRLVPFGEAYFERREAAEGPTREEALT